MPTFDSILEQLGATRLSVESDHLGILRSLRVKASSSRLRCEGTPFWLVSSSIPSALYEIVGELSESNSHKQCTHPIPDFGT